MKALLAGVLRLTFRILPTSVALPLCRVVPPLYGFLPKDREYVCSIAKYRAYAKPLYGIELEMLRGYEPDVTAIAREHVHPGMNALDVGANVGAVSLFLADLVGPTGHVFAFEPGPTTFSRLLRNLALNPDARQIVHPLNVGCGDRAGELVYHELAHARGNAILGDLDAQFTAHESHRVRVETIDDIVSSKQIPKVDFIKIDVEGMEYEVLVGAQRTLQRDRPVICYETLPQVRSMTGGENFARIESLLTSIGYRLYRVEGSTGHEAADRMHFTMNTVAIPEGSPSRAANATA